MHGMEVEGKDGDRGRRGFENGMGGRGGSGHLGIIHTELCPLFSFDSNRFPLLYHSPKKHDVSV